MTRLIFSVFFILLLITPLLSAQQTLQDLTLSSAITKGFIPSPIVVTNDFKNEWLVAWNQSGKVKGRIVKPDGQLSSIKTLVKGRVLDAVYDPIHHTYLILYNSRSYVRAQLLSGSLKKKGDVISFSSPPPVMAQLIFDPVAGKFLVFWIEYTGQDPDGHYLTAIKSGSLGVTGKAFSEIVTVLDGGSHVEYQQLRVARNPENGNLFLLVDQLAKGVASIFGYTLKSDRTFLRTKPVRFAGNSVPPTNSFSVPDAEFADNGTGIATWKVEDLNGISPTKIKIRQLTSKGTFNSKSKTIAEDVSQPRIVLDRGQNAFLVLWYENLVFGGAHSVSAVLLDAITANVLKGPFTVAKPEPLFGYVKGLAGAYERSSGRILIVWSIYCLDVISNSCPGSVYVSGQVSGAIFSSQ